MLTGVCDAAVRGDNSSTDWSDWSDWMRFLFAEFSPEALRDITLELKMFVGFAPDYPDSLYQKYLADRGIAVSRGDFCQLK